MSEVYWKTPFPLVYQKVKQLPLGRQLAPNHLILLALENQLLTSEEYLTWAQKFYGLARANDSFFNEQLSANTYEKYKNQFEWGLQAIPIFEWEDVVFVACLDPLAVPSDLPFLCRPVLASYEVLKATWNRFLTANHDHGTVGHQSPKTEDHISSSEAAAKTSVQLPTEEATQYSTKNDEFDPATLNNFTFGENPGASSAPFGKGENLFELEETKPDVAEEGDEGSDDPHKDNSFEAPEGLDFGAPTLATKPAEPQLTPHFAVNPMEAPPEPKAPPPPPPPKTAPAITSPPPISTPKMATPPPMVGSTSTTKTPVPPPPLAKTSSSPTQPTVANLPPPASIEIEEELMLCFAKAYQNYRNLMVLKYTSGILVPFRWDPSYKVPETLSPIDISTPSVFKIVIDSKKPFHGGISSSPVNDQFIQVWLSGHTPKYLTIVPVHYEGELAGMLLAASDEILDRKTSLDLMRSTAAKVESNFGVRIAA